MEFSEYREQILKSLAEAGHFGGIETETLIQFGYVRLRKAEDIVSALLRSKA